jgi:plasmid stabilization system protein ParE
MGFQVVYAPRALEDLEQIVRYVAEDDSPAALRLGYRLADQAESLGFQPHRGSVLRTRSGLRKLVSPPYLIVYRVNDELEVVEILRFWHGARDLRRIDIP